MCPAQEPLPSHFILKIEVTLNVEVQPLANGKIRIEMDPANRIGEIIEQEDVGIHVAKDWSRSHPAGCIEDRPQQWGPEFGRRDSWLVMSAEFARYFGDSRIISEKDDLNARKADPALQRVSLNDVGVPFEWLGNREDSEPLVHLLSDLVSTGRKHVGMLGAG